MKHVERFIEVDLDAIASNVVLLKKVTGKKILACVKCDAYGLGAVAVSKRIEKHIDWFGVATIDEAISLRKAGIIKPILVLAPVSTSVVNKAMDYNISLTAASIDFISKVNSASKLSIHIKIDTGMGRAGILPCELNEAIRILGKSKVKIEGIFSHLSNSENPDKTFSLKQIKIFSGTLSVIPAQSKIITHIANSGGIVNVPESVESFSMVRTGLLLYGVYPTLFLRVFKKISGLRYALKGVAKIILVRDVPAGTAISYGGTYVCSKDTRIAIAGIGYGDGLDRALSNNFFMKYNDKLFPVRGRICMDQTILEIDQSVDEGSKIVFLDQELSVEDMAGICRTVPQEILTRFGVPRLKKVYIGKRN
ncbi:MAG: alanine racemase [Candidatus Omnitrophica bacterium]|nr:alanine racemase [Candidatus Omnitrophota bacterium]